jgi:hypothetical protein
VRRQHSFPGYPSTQFNSVPFARAENTVMKKLLISLVAVGCLQFVLSSYAQVPGIINYQGRIVDNGTNFDGTGLFQFALVDGTGATNYWSNDGTAVGQPSAAVSLTVMKGLYSVLLGDTTLTNMAAIPVAVFTNADVRLRVWFNDGVTGFQQLSPDQRLAAVGFALISASVPDGSITSNKIAAGAVGPSALAVGLMTASDISNNFVTASQESTVSNLAASAASTNFVAAALAGATFSNVASSYIVHLDTGVTNFYPNLYTCLTSMTNNCHAYVNGIYTYTKTGSLVENLGGEQAMFNFTRLTNVIVDGSPGTRFVVDNQCANDTVSGKLQFLDANYAANITVRNLEFEFKARNANQTNVNMCFLSAAGVTNGLFQNIHGQDEYYVTNGPVASPHGSDMMIVAAGSTYHNLTFDNCVMGQILPPSLYPTNSYPLESTFCTAHTSPNSDVTLKNCVRYGVEYPKSFWDGVSAGDNVNVIYDNCRVPYMGGIIALTGFTPYNTGATVDDWTNMAYWFGETENRSYYFTDTDPIFFGWDCWSNQDCCTVFPTNSPVAMALALGGSSGLITNGGNANLFSLNLSGNASVSGVLSAGQFSAYNGGFRVANNAMTVAIPSTLTNVTQSAGANWVGQSPVTLSSNYVGAGFGIGTLNVTYTNYANTFPQYFAGVWQGPLISLGAHPWLVVFYNNTNEWGILNKNAFQPNALGDVNAISTNGGVTWYTNSGYQSSVTIGSSIGGNIAVSGSGAFNGAVPGPVNMAQGATVGGTSVVYSVTGPGLSTVGGAVTLSTNGWSFGGGGALVAVTSDKQLGTAPAGSGLPQSAYLALPTNSVAPAGYTLLGTTKMTYKYQVGTKRKTATVTLNLYQKD